jgi:hypothetical protein
VAETNQTSNIDLSPGTARFVVSGNPANLNGNAATLAAFAAAQNPSIPVVSNTTASRTFGASNFAVISSALDPGEMQLALKLIF